MSATLLFKHLIEFLNTFVIEVYEIFDYAQTTYRAEHTELNN